MPERSTWEVIRNSLPWVPGYFWQRCIRRMPHSRPIHLVIGIANHFEPPLQKQWASAAYGTTERNSRLKQWCREYPAAMGCWRDGDGRPLRHTYFYAAESCEAEVLDLLAEHCHAGWGEVEIQLHHGVESPDTAENTRTALSEFRDALAARGLLCRDNGSDLARYAFVHGNWALANSAQGQFCGVDQEMQILADTGCYADFTLPAPSCAQIAKINSIYECGLPLNHRAPHRRGHDLRAGRAPKTFPLIVEGPLLVDLGRRTRTFFPSIESSELSGINPPTMRRFELWRKAAISVAGRPEWLFIKLHCHGMAAGQATSLYGEAMQAFVKQLVQNPRNHVEYELHFVTLREMVNIILAACNGKTGNPGKYRDYRLRLTHSAAQP